MILVGAEPSGSGETTGAVLYMLIAIVLLATAMAIRNAQEGTVDSLGLARKEGAVNQRSSRRDRRLDMSRQIESRSCVLLCGHW